MNEISTKCPDGPADTHRRPCSSGLVLAALGVVFGDIGTSPLYALKQTFGGAHALPFTEANVLGVLSLIVWSLIIVISFKYVIFVMRADNRGEGGVLALMSIARPTRKNRAARSPLIIFPGLFGAALLYGDGVITPAISVMSAVEGLHLVTPLFDPYILQITIAILIGIFVVQRHGTQRIGTIFGPFILLWFASIGVLGLIEIIDSPFVAKALSPHYAVLFFTEHGWASFATLGGVFLVVTGGESLYADMGHFGPKPIRIGWFAVALPLLLLNYFGQGALLLRNPAAIKNPFFLLAPAWGLLPLVLIATCATVIASQAVISGAFSLTRQAIQLGFLPRMEIQHTSSQEIGQIYVAPINWGLLVLAIWVVLEFGSASELASAYGVAVSGTMVVTTYMMFFVARRHWGWSLPWTLLVILPLLVIDLSFFSANALKMFEGGWVPLALGVVIFVLMTTWRKGRELLALRLAENLMPFDTFIKSFRGYPRSAGTSIFMTRNIDLTPPALLHNVRHNKVLHEHVVLMLVDVLEVPFVPPSERFTIEKLQAGFFRITVHFGYLDDPDIPEVMQMVEQQVKYLKASEAIFFLGRETLIATERPGMALWRENLFAFMSRNAQAATRFFRLPSERVVEIGLQVEL